VSTLYTAGLSSLVGYGIFNSLLARYPSSLVVPWVLIVPVVAMASAWALLGQSPNGAESAGGALLLAGAFVALRPRRISRDAKAALAQPVPVSASVRNALSMPCSGAM
jgi:O-acetylserine/cysteine efflux transporter